jgi:hypothetical protein
MIGIEDAGFTVKVSDGEIYISDILTANNKPRMTLFAPSLPNNEEDNGHVMTRGFIMLVFHLKIYLNNIFFYFLKFIFNITNQNKLKTLK